MWKQSWNKLKTALGSPEDYIEEEEKAEPEEAQEVQQEEASESEFCSDPQIPVAREDLVPVLNTMQSIKNLKGLGGEMFLRHEQEKAEFIKANNALNAQMTQQILDLRTTYNVEPTIDYVLNFPAGEEEEGSFVRHEEPDSES
tara:strand:+ start:8391 stop:8819 length:429 start_codon:yes stop_codon:yes gene_type:complete